MNVCLEQKCYIIIDIINFFKILIKINIGRFQKTKFGGKTLVNVLARQRPF